MNTQAILGFHLFGFGMLFFLLHNKKLIEDSYSTYFWENSRQQTG